VLMTPWDLPLERRREIAEWGRRMGEERDDEFMQSSAAAFEATAQDYLAWFSEREPSALPTARSSGSGMSC
jgi:hypothetical protein